MKMRRHSFTLIELLVSVALLVILTVVLMQFFSAARTFWTAGNEQGQLYGDAKIALSVLTDDLENVINRQAKPDWQQSASSQDAETQVTIPFVATFTSSYLSGSEQKTLRTDAEPSSLLDYYQCAGDLVAPRLLFVTRIWSTASTPAQMRPALVIWDFIPPQIEKMAGRNQLIKDTGVLRRCVIPFDDNVEHFCKRLRDSNSNIFTEQLHFEGIPASEYEEKFPIVVDGILNVQFRVYARNSHKPYALYYKEGADSSAKAWNAVENNSSQTATEGMENVDSIQVVLTMMPKAKMLELKTLDDQEEQNEFIRKNSRTLTKTITIGGDFHE